MKRIKRNRKDSNNVFGKYERKKDEQKLVKNQKVEVRIILREIKETVLQDLVSANNFRRKEKQRIGLK